MQAVQDFLFPIVLFLFYFYVFSRFVSNGSRNDFSLNSVVSLVVDDHGFSDDLSNVNSDDEVVESGDEIVESGDEIVESGDEVEIEDGGDDLERLTVRELKNLASSYGLKIKSKTRKSEIIQILRSST